MKRKILVVSLLSSTIMMGVLSVPAAQAQDTYPNVKGLTPFTQPANYMSLPGVLRWRYLLSSGRWISRVEAEQQVRNQGVSARLDPTNWRYQARQAAKKAHTSAFDRGF